MSWAGDRNTFIRALVLLSCLATCGSVAKACGGPFDIACNVGATVKKGVEDIANTGKKAIEDTADTGKKAIDDSVQAGEKAAEDTVNTGKKAVSDTVNTGKKAIDDVLRNAQKAADDLVWNSVKGANDIVDAGKAAGRFVESEVRGAKDSLSAAEKRIREGKVVDAAWHLGTDPLKNSERSAAQAAQESALINAAGQTAASFYGGPAGAAAYASWYAYRATNNVETALRVGLITGITNAGYANVSAMPAGTVGEISKKALVTGTMGGLAVAAGGGDDVAVREAFLKSGGMVVVQSGQSYVTRKYVDPAVAKADTYCMSAVGSKCSVVLPKLQRDGQGIVLDENGRPKVDASVVLAGRDRLGSWQRQAEAAGQDAVKRNIPGAEQVFTKDNQWAVSWDRKAFTNRSASVPAVVLTYTGPGSPFDDKVQEIKAWAASPATEAVPSRSPDGSVVERISEGVPTWAPLTKPGGSALLFDRVFPAAATGPVVVGEILRSRGEIAVRPSPADATAKRVVLKKGALVSVTGTSSLVDETGSSRDWARIEIVGPDVGAAPLRSPDWDGDNEAGGEVGVALSESTGLKFPVWCFEKYLRHGFEVRADGKVRGLTTDFSGLARRHTDGSIRIRALRPADLGALDLPWRETVRARIGADGELVVTDYSGATSKGFCRSVI